MACSIATLAAGASASFSLTVSVGAVGGTTIANTATQSSATTDNVPGNNAATASTQIAAPLPAQPAPALSPWLLVLLSLLILSFAKARGRTRFD